ncbi:hypothetical protein F5X96DRAFT_656235 [Biscogniauxia mediterranea]|nr:hypothetical protein F5X96DRAFT_656235 [Biscogniauxia mediterranea]
MVWGSNQSIGALGLFLFGFGFFYINTFFTLSSSITYVPILDSPPPSMPRLALGLWLYIVYISDQVDGGWCIKVGVVGILGEGGGGSLFVLFWYRFNKPRASLVSLLPPPPPPPRT